MSDESNTSVSGDEWLNLTARRDITVRHIAELAQVQVDLRKWYTAKPGKPTQQSNLDACPALVRMMQIIRLLRESQLEFEQELGQSSA